MSTVRRNASALLRRLVGVAAAIASCVEVPAATTGCVPGQVIACPCLGGARGTQTCAATGAYGACSCVVAPLPVVPSGTRVGPAGATVVAADGRARVEIPAGAFAEAVPVTITPMAASPAGAAGTMYEVGPSGMRFRAPVRLRVPYDPAMIPPGSSEEDLALTTVVAGELDVQPWSVIDRSTRTIEGLVLHFSPWLAAVLPFTAERCPFVDTCFTDCCRRVLGTPGQRSACPRPVCALPGINDFVCEPNARFATCGTVAFNDCLADCGGSRRRVNFSNNPCWTSCCEGVGGSSTRAGACMVPVPADRDAVHACILGCERRPAEVAACTLCADGGSDATADAITDVVSNPCAFAAQFSPDAPGASFIPACTDVCTRMTQEIACVGAARRDSTVQICRELIGGARSAPCRAELEAATRCSFSAWADGSFCAAPPPGVCAAQTDALSRCVEPDGGTDAGIDAGITPPTTGCDFPDEPGVTRTGLAVRPACIQLCQRTASDRSCAPSALLGVQNSCANLIRWSGCCFAQELAVYQCEAANFTGCIDNNPPASAACLPQRMARSVCRAGCQQ